MSNILPFWLTEGGWVLWLLILLSIISFFLISFIGLNIRKTNVKEIDKLNPADALLSQQGSQKSSAHINQKISFILSTFAKKNLENKNFIDQVTIEIQLLVNQLNQGMRPLEVISTISPLIGLFGTVLGMINAFQKLAEAGNKVDPSILSAGIWQALLTTAGGLIVAVPAIVAWHYFDRKIDVIRLILNKKIIEADAAYTKISHMMPQKENVA